MYGLNILITCLFLHNATGSELYFYELAKSLSKLGHNVTILTNFYSDYFQKKSIEDNFRIITIKKLQEINIPDKIDFVIVSHANKMYQHVFKFNISKYAKFVNIVHSEIYGDEDPVLNEKIDKYIAVRKSIQDRLVNKFNVPIEKTQIIFNPIDVSKFNTDDTSDDNFGIFIGTLNELRLQACLDFKKFCKAKNLRTIYVGSDNHLAVDYDEKLNPVWDIENYVKKCTISGGIIHGRTYWEAKLCGKETLEYIVDGSGKILERIYENKPDAEELNQVYNKVAPLKVAESIIFSVYSKI